jgi:hypothetical protein
VNQELNDEQKRIRKSTDDTTNVWK